MAARQRYRKQRYLIDPSIFAVYWIVLRLILIVVFFAMTVSAVALAATGQGLGAVLRIFFQYPMAAVKVFAWVTLVFVVLDIVQAKLNFFDKWDPRSLPKPSKSHKCASDSRQRRGNGGRGRFWRVVAGRTEASVLALRTRRKHYSARSVLQTRVPLDVAMVISVT